MGETTLHKIQDVEKIVQRKNDPRTVDCEESNEALFLAARDGHTCHELLFDIRVNQRHDLAEFVLLFGPRVGDCERLY